MERYEPSSDFLLMVIDKEISFEGEFGARNLKRLIALTRDSDSSNRDWATLLLAQTELDTPDIRAVFLERARDQHDGTRAEAILALAERRAPEALALVEAALNAESVGTIAVEAAGYVGDPALLPALHELRDWWDIHKDLLERTITACEKGKPFGT